MNIKHYPELEEIEAQNNYLPSISLILPFQSRPEEEFLKYIKIKKNELERKLNESYNKEVIQMMMGKFNALVSRLKIDKFKQGLAIFLSPVFEKIYYLDFEPAEKVVIDDSFEVRDLIFNHDIINKAILLLLSGNEIRFMALENHKIHKIHVDVPLHIEAFMANTLHDVAVFYEKSDRKEKAAHVFVKNADHGLSMLLLAHSYPVIVAGSDKLISEFKAVSKNTEAIIDYIPGNYLESTNAELTHLILHSLKRMNQNKQLLILNRLNNINIRGYLAIGVKEAWKESSDKNVDLLVVEKNFRMLAGFNPGKNEIFIQGVEKIPFPVIDAVDDIIEKVICAGGKVQFVDDGALRDFMHIVLIKNHFS